MASRKTRVVRVVMKFSDVLDGVSKNNDITTTEASDLIADLLIQDKVKLGKTRKIIKEIEF